MLGGDELVMSQVGDHVHECVHDDLLGKVNNKAEREEEVDLGSGTLLTNDCQDSNAGEDTAEDHAHLRKVVGQSHVGGPAVQVTSLELEKEPQLFQYEKRRNTTSLCIVGLIKMYRPTSKLTGQISAPAC